MQVGEIPRTIAIDGPAASGKSTVGYRLAEALDYLFLDTGAMYRALTLAAIRNAIPLDDEQALTALATSKTLDILPARDSEDGRQYTVLLDGEDVTWAIRSPEVDAAVSEVSAHPCVREVMVKRQQAFGDRGEVVMVGRDIGTVVLPDAPLKYYITASPEERARRRLRDRQERGGDEDFETILAEVQRRDEVDSGREHSPLRPAADAIVVDTTGLSIEEVVVSLLEGLERPSVAARES